MKHHIKDVKIKTNNTTYETLPTGKSEWIHLLFVYYSGFTSIYDIFSSNMYIVHINNDNPN